MPDRPEGTSGSGRLVGGVDLELAEESQALLIGEKEIDRAQFPCLFVDCPATVSHDTAFVEAVNNSSYWGVRFGGLEQRLHKRPRAWLALAAHRGKDPRELDLITADPETTDDRAHSSSRCGVIGVRPVLVAFQLVPG